MIWRNAKDGKPPAGKLCLVYTGHGETVLASHGWFGGWTIYGVPLRQRLRFRFLGEIMVCGTPTKINILWWCRIVPPEGEEWTTRKGGGFDNARAKPGMKPSLTP